MPVGDIRFPAEGTGKRVATRFDIEVTQKEFARYRPENNRIPDGSYAVAFTQRGITATIGGTNNAGIGFIYNPTTSGRQIAIKRVQIIGTKTGNAIRLSAPRLVTERFYAPSTPTGATVPYAKLRTTEVDSAMYVSEINTGLSTTGQDALFAIYPLIQMTTASNPPGVLGMTAWWWDFDDEEAPIIGPGEGIRIARQVESGDATDGGRQVQATVWWNEFTQEF